jgi:hypothetical protein
VIRLDAATVLLQWAAGGMAFLWITTRHRQVSLGYGWLVRAVYLVLAGTAVVIGAGDPGEGARDLLAGLFSLLIASALLLSVLRRRAGVRGRVEEHDRRSARVAAMTGIERSGPTVTEEQVAEFPPLADLVAAVAGLAAVVAGALDAGSGHELLSVARHVAGALFLGAVSDAMLLGHWYLVQPGLPRAPLLELVRWVGWTWVPEVAFLLWPVGMLSVLSGSVDDGYGGLLGWFWVLSALTTIVLVFVTRAALRERYYSAVMAATGLLYLAILTAFGTDLVARAVLA